MSYLAQSAIFTWLLVARVYEELLLAGDALQSVGAAALESPGVVLTDAAIDTRLALAVVLRVLLASLSLNSGQTDASKAPVVGTRLLAGPSIQTRNAGTRTRWGDHRVPRLAQVPGKPAGTLAPERLSLGVYPTPGAVLAWVTEAGVVDVARDAAVPLGADADEPARDLRRATDPVVETRVGGTRRL